MKRVLFGCVLLLLALVGCGQSAEVAAPGSAGSSGASKLSDPAVVQEAEPPARLAEPPAEVLTASPAATPTELPGVAPPATLTPSPTPSSRLRQLTTGGCCTQPFWSADSRRVMFIDKPAPDAPTGIWGVDVTQPESSPDLVTERIGFYTADFQYLVELQEDTTIIERLEDGERWAVPAGGRPVYFSPSRQHIAWEASNDAPFERRVSQVWVANLDGSDARMVAELKRGGFSGWIRDDLLLLSAYESFDSREEALYTFSLSNGETNELVHGQRLRGGSLSPDGEWMAYFITFSENPDENGLWVVRTDGTARHKLDNDLFGAYQWRDAHRLLIIPFDPNAESHELWEYDVRSGESRRVTNPDATPFKVANGDWAVSPDGDRIVFVSSHDKNIWLLTLPD